MVTTMKRTLLLPIFLLLAVVALGVGCSTNPKGVELLGELIYKPHYAEGFSIYRSEDYTLLITKNPWQGAEGIERKLMILKPGKSAPEGFEGEILNGHAKRIVCMSSSHIAMLSSIGADSLIVGVSGMEFITNSYIKENRDKIGDVGYDGNINYELLLSLDPDIVLMYGVFGTGVMEPKLRELGIPFVYIGEYVEQEPLGKAEWVVAIGEIAGLRLEAEELYKDIPTRYNELSKMARALDSRPRVMINIPYADQWYMPSTKSYTAKLIEDAGGEYLFQRATNGSDVIDIEEALQLAFKADVWMDVKLNNIDELKRNYPRFADIKSVVEGRVYNNDLRETPGGGNDYWESGILYPHLVLQDMIMILHPELQLGKEFSYYRQLK